MPDHSLVDTWFDQWEQARAQGREVPLDQFIEQHCRGSPPAVIEAFRSQANALQSMAARLKGATGPGHSTCPGGPQDTSPSAARVNLTPGAEPVPGYRLEKRLGRGGFGEVWRATAPGGMPVALKFVSLEPQKARAELRALEILKKVRHPHLLATVGYWQHEGHLIIAMELADRTLMARFLEAVRQGHPGIPGPELLGYMAEAAQGLDYLNEPRQSPGGGGVGIQHRDVKPHNLLLLGGCVKVGDFGLARCLEHSQASHTGSMTAAYAAPEFFHGRTSRHSDQYCLAVTYCQLRGGRLPFTGNAPALMAGHLHRVPDLTMLPAEERPVVARALAKKPQERWPSCAAFVEALAGGETQPVAVPRARPAAPPRRRSLWQAGTAAVTLLVAVPLALHLWQSFGQPGGRGDPAEDGRASLDRQATVKGSPSGDRGGKDEGKIDKDDPKSEVGPQQGRPFTNSLGMQFAWVEPGSFLMGSPDGKTPTGVPAEYQRSDEETPHKVTLTKGFHMGVHLVNQAQWERVMGKDANLSKFVGWNRNEQKRLPVDSVTWEDCQGFYRKLGAREGRTYKLPTEAQWEYACRAGTRTAFWWGDSITADQANYDGNFTYGKDSKNGAHRKSTTPVDSFRANPWGLYDMHGNLYQWCEDVYQPYPEDAVIDAIGVTERATDVRVQRGGSWYSYPNRCRAAYRSRGAPAMRFDDVGCRVVLCLD